MLSAGEKLGPYEIVDLLGTGGMGEVYRARDARLGRDVAIKVVRRAAQADAERLRRFEQEARAAGILNHPNVLAIYDVGSHEGTPYLVSELLEGETLRQRLADGALPPARVLKYATEIAEGLAAAHAKAIVHRDLKPENLFITTDGRIKILDFGLAKLVENDAARAVDSKAPTAESVAQVVGTVSYMSPEQIRVLPVDHRSDIFALGAVVYEMLTGRRAFEGASMVETMNAALKDDPPDLFRLPAGLDLIVQHCLEKEPAHRFQSARDLAFHLKALSSGTESGTRLPAFVRRPRRRLPVQPLLLGALTLAVGVGAFVLGARVNHQAPAAFRQLTFRRGMVLSARFTPDGRNIVYGAAWDGRPVQVFATQPESPESRPLELPQADVLSVSASGELAVSLGRRSMLGFESRGTLARIPFSGGAPRELLTDVESADWAPDGAELAVIHVVGGRYRLEYPIGTALYESAGWLSHVRMAPDGARIAFVEHPVRSDDRGDVFVVDRDGRNRRVVAGGYSSITGLAWPEGGRELWFTAATVGGRTALFSSSLAHEPRLVLETPGRIGIEDVRGGRALLTEGRLRLRVALRDLRQSPGTELDLSWLDGSIGTDLSDDGAKLLISEQGVGAGTQSYATYLRSTGAAPAVRLGDGLAQALSPDGREAAAVRLDPRSSIVLFPTGPGEARTLPPGSVTRIDAVTWFPDGRRLLFAGSEGKAATRLYVQDVDAGEPRVLSADGLRIPYPSKAVSPDGRSIAAVGPDDQLWIQPSDGGPARALPGLAAGDRPVRWSGDGATLYVFRRNPEPARILAVDIAKGTNQPVAEIAPRDRAGTKPPIAVQMTPDGHVYAYSYSETLTDLYLATGLK